MSSIKSFLVALVIISVVCVECSYAACVKFKPLKSTSAISCTETDNTAQDGVFSIGYTATFETLADGTSVRITFELLDTDKVGVVAFLWKQSPFTEVQMTNVGNNVFSETITGLTNGQTITYACKFAFAGGLAVTKYINYDVGDSCEAGPEADASLSDIKVDGVTIQNFSPAKKKYVIEYSSETTVVPTVTATTTQSGAEAVISPANNLPGTTTILVTAENGISTRTYSIEFREELVLVWSDEFNEDGAINSDNWHHQTFPPFGGNWANGEIQHYTNRTDNSIIENGVLKIIGKKEQGYTQDGSVKDYTSARLNSKFAFTYGRVDISAKMPPEAGTWPALWLLGKNISEAGAYWETKGFGNTVWPKCGEIDIMEQFKDKNHIAAAIHTPVSYGDTQNKGEISANTSTTEFHLYSIIWTEDKIEFLYDDEEYYTYDPVGKYGGKNTDLANNDMNWPFDNPQYLILNVALGGLVGNPDADFVDAVMEVDYVRVYQEKSDAIISLEDDTFSVEENSATGTEVGSVSATYTGVGSLTYSITDGNQDQIFRIDETSGEITVLDGSKLDFETTSRYDLTIEVTDGQITDFANITINITDVFEFILDTPNGSSSLVSIYPNPVNTLAKLEITNPAQTKLHSLTDLQGKIILIPITKQSYTYQLDFSNVSPGIYVLLLEVDHVPIHVKIKKL